MFGEALWRGPQGQELRTPAKGHMAEPPREWILQPQLAFRDCSPVNSLTAAS